MDDTGVHHQPGMMARLRGTTGPADRCGGRAEEPAQLCWIFLEEAAALNR